MPADILDALREAVETTGEAYLPHQWTFADSTPLQLIARRITPSGTGHDRLVLTADCRTRWVMPGEETGEVAAALAAAGTMVRSEIEWVLVEEARYGTARWHLSPVADLGWVCTRKPRLGRARRYAVATNRAYRRLAPGSPRTVEAVLRDLLDGPPPADA